MQPITRREFSQQALGSLLTYSLLETLFAHDAFASEVRPKTVEWLAGVNALGQDVQGQKLPQVEWQQQVEKLFSRVNLPDLLQLIDFDRLTKGIKLVDRGRSACRSSFQRSRDCRRNTYSASRSSPLKKGVRSFRTATTTW